MFYNYVLTWMTFFFVKILKASVDKSLLKRSFQGILVKINMHTDSVSYLFLDLYSPIYEQSVLEVFKLYQSLGLEIDSAPSP